MQRSFVFILSLILNLTLLGHTAHADEVSTSDVNEAHKTEVCTVVLKKLKSSFEKLRTGKITDTKTAKVANLAQTYRLFECGNDQLLFDVLACTNTQIMFLEDCRKVKF